MRSIQRYVIHRHTIDPNSPLVILSEAKDLLSDRRYAHSALISLFGLISYGASPIRVSF
jgi:hypothetical protein